MKKFVLATLTVAFSSLIIAAGIYLTSNQPKDVVAGPIPTENITFDLHLNQKWEENNYKISLNIPVGTEIKPGEVNADKPIESNVYVKNVGWNLKFTKPMESEATHYDSAVKLESSKMDIYRVSINDQVYYVNHISFDKSCEYIQEQYPAPCGNPIVNLGEDYNFFAIVVQTDGDYSVTDQIVSSMTVEVEPIR